VIARARHDRAAFAALYDFYLSRIYAFCMVHSSSREEAEDLTAQTFERALVAIERYEDRGVPFSRWLLRIAANAAADRGRRTPKLALPHDGGAGDDTTGGGGERGPVDHWVEEWEKADWLEAHLAALPGDQRQVVRLRFYDDQDFRGVATAMGRSEGAVKQLLRRALGALRQRIHEEALGGD